MEEQTHQNEHPGHEPKYPEYTPGNLPNSTPVLVLGILSIVFSCWYFSIIGVVLGIIALVLANRDMALYNLGKDQYSLSSFNNLKAGRTCAIIGVIVGTIVFVIFLLFIIGLLATIPFWGMIDKA